MGGRGELLIVGVNPGICSFVEVEAAVMVGAGFGRNTLHAKIVSARMAMRKEKGCVLDSPGMGQVLPHCILQILPPQLNWLIFL